MGPHDPRARSARERAFHARHLGYDALVTGSGLLRYHLTASLRGDRDHLDFLRDWTAGNRPPGVAPEVAAVLDRQAPTALLLNAFLRRLRSGDQRTPYPAAAFEEALRDRRPVTPRTIRPGRPSGAFPRTGRRR
ncbi:hypothetical protein ABT084_07370 [Streptomyces sp. NPDC002138]|uniref:hypothetical protein n=1 Tax=Streptomyces sp. NPDC002138 TaxID=3154410 RepID=UPI00331CE915